MKSIQRGRHLLSTSGIRAAVGWVTVMTLIVGVGSADDFPAVFVPGEAPDPSSFTVEISASLAGSSQDSSGLSGDAILGVAQSTAPYGIAQLLDVNLTLVDGMNFSLLGGTITVAAAPGAAHIRMIDSGPAGTVTNGQFDQLENLFEFTGEIMLSTQEGPFDLSSVAPIQADLLGIRLENRGAELVASVQVDLEFTAAVASPIGQIPLAIAFQGYLDAVASLGTVGDFDENQVLDAADIDLLHTAIREGSMDLRYDLNRDGALSDLDSQVMIRDLLLTYYGDADLDGVFGPSDLILAFQFGLYEDNIPLNAGWRSGDWNGDGEFTSADLVRSLQDGCYESCAGPRAAAQAVPEPSVWWPLVVAILAIHRPVLRRVTASR